MTDNPQRGGISAIAIYQLFGLLLGIACIAAGLFLLYFGAVRHTAGTLSPFGLPSTLNDAVSGIILLIIGVAAVWIIHNRTRANPNAT